MSVRRPSSSALLRAAAVLSLLYCLGHLSGMPWTPGEGTAPESVIAQMRAVPFPVEGMTRTYWSFYSGFGHLITAFLAMQAFALWALARVASREPKLATPVSLTFLAGVAVNAALSFVYFFPLPGLFSVVIALLLAASVWLASRRVVTDH